MVFTVGHHVRGRGHPVGQIEECHCLRQIENIVLAQSRIAQGGAVVVVDQVGGCGKLPGEVQHRPLTSVELRHPIVQCHHFAKLGIARNLANRRAMGHQAVVAAVGGRHDDRHHLPLQLRQAGVGQHDLVIHRHEVAQPLGPEAVGVEHVRHEPQLFHAFPPKHLEIVVQRLRVGDAELGDMVRLGHRD